MIYPPIPNLMRVCLEFVEDEMVSRRRPWPDHIQDATIREARLNGWLDSYTRHEGLQTAGGIFGETSFEDELTDAGREKLAMLRAVGSAGVHIGAERAPLDDQGQWRR